MSCSTAFCLLIFGTILSVALDYIIGWVFSVQLFIIGILLIILGAGEYKKRRVSEQKKTKPLLMIWGGIALIVFVIIRCIFSLMQHKF